MSDILILPSGGGSGSDDCTATRAQLLSGYTGILSDTDDEPGAGTMVNRGAVSQSLPINGSYTIPQGYHNGSGKVTQSIPTQGGSTTTPGTATKTIVAANRYVTGNIVVAGDGNLVPGNIKRGVRIFGVTGNWEGYVGGSNDLYYLGANNAGFSTTSSSISFESGAIYYDGTDYTLFIISSKSYNLSAWTKLNVQFVMTSSLGNGILGIALGDNIYNGNPDASIRDSSINSKLNQTITASLDISNVNKTTQIKFFIGPTNLNNKFYGQVKRIWLS